MSPIDVITNKPCAVEDPLSCDFCAGCVDCRHFAFACFREDNQNSSVGPICEGMPGFIRPILLSKNFNRVCPNRDLPVSDDVRFYSLPSERRILYNPDSVIPRIIGVIPRSEAIQRIADFFVEGP